MLVTKQQWQYSKIMSTLYNWQFGSIFVAKLRPINNWPQFQIAYGIPKLFRGVIPPDHRPGMGKCKGGNPRTQWLEISSQRHILTHIPFCCIWMRSNCVYSALVLLYGVCLYLYHFHIYVVSCGYTNTFVIERLRLSCGMLTFLLRSIRFLRGLRHICRFPGFSGGRRTADGGAENAEVEMQEWKMREYIAGDIATDELSR